MFTSDIHYQTDSLQNKHTISVWFWDLVWEVYCQTYYSQKIWPGGSSHTINTAILTIQLLRADLERNKSFVNINVGLLPKQIKQERILKF